MTNSILRAMAELVKKGHKKKQQLEHNPDDKLSHQMGTPNSKEDINTIGVAK